MEHVAKHLEKATSGREAPITLGGPNDPTLMKWASGPDIAIVKLDSSGWKLNYPFCLSRNSEAATDMIGA